MPIAAPTVATEPVDDDPFSTAFASLTGPEPALGDPVAAAPVDPAAVVDPAVADPAVVDPAVVDPAAAVAADPAAAVAAAADVVDPVAAAPAAVDPAKPVDPAANDDMLRRLAALVKAPPAVVQPQAAAPVELLTPEEKTLLATYDKDWPDVSRAEAIRRRADLREAINHVFTEVHQFIQPLMARVTELSTSAQLGEIEAAVPDYNDVRDKVIEWAGKEPLPYLRAAYDHVIKQGTPAEVADLIQRFKQATGATIAAPAAAPAAAVELPTAVKKAAAALAPVKSARSGPVSSGVDKNDFDGMFEKLAAAEKVK